ncbi:hypothetical protein BOX37_15735 [Nocardia mangyaensis]|uniref:SGNH hydrolase-type esterase domain-containing protein n=1 Tax=Nocardia mangyaensis TaxID=2213200 RepID=A0A1J0VT99_9NOCA|nr:hypothetical protein [Nocardia mangyaensis]APE35159.1 hypothetical protein BOX37_15735 [Nocardia mangyaensis]
MSGDLRICFVGDSFVQGIGDPEYRGWVGRVLAETGTDITAFNLGIRRNTPDDIRRRCWAEVEPRFLPAEFIDITTLLADDPGWAEEARAGDGAHPGSGGYRRLADLVLDGGWREWIARP